MIVEDIREHGTPIHVEREFHMKPYRKKKDACYYGDILAVYEKGVRWYLVGIEVKDWKARVGAALAREYLLTYGSVCEYFYLAARRFTSELLAAPFIGLFSLEKMEVVKRPDYLCPDEHLRGHAIKRMKKQGLNERVVESPSQTMLDEFF